MPHQPKGSLYFKTRITLPDGRTGLFACGTTSEDVANDVERMVKTFQHDRVWTPLLWIMEGRTKLSLVYDAYKSGELAHFLSALSSPDISALVDAWPAGPKYKTQVRCLIPEGEIFPAAGFTKRTVSEFLAGLECSGSTKNRYRAALSVFAKWLVERDIIPTNVVRDVGSFKPNPARMVWLDRGQAKALVGALPMPYRAIEALMAATGVEWQVVERLMGRDVDLKARTIHAHGSKTPWRNRVVRATEIWAWKIFADHAKSVLDNGQVFSVSKYKALHEHLDAASVLGLPRTTLHDWRHTYAVISLKDGYSLQIVAHQLGHRDTTLVQSRYGRFIPAESDYHVRRPLSNPKDARRARPRSA